MEGIDGLLRLCRTGGKDWNRCQGAGGNASVKVSARRMLVTASGTSMRSLTGRRGWTLLDPRRLRRDLKRTGALRSARREPAYAASLSRLAQGPLPSLESGLHAAIPSRYVLHLHSAAGMLLARQGRAGLRFAEETLPGTLVQRTPAVLPGYALAARIAGGRLPARGRIALWLLENHGIVLSGDDLRAVEIAVEALERAGADRYGLRRFRRPHRLGTRGCRCRRKDPRVVCFCSWPAADFSLEPVFPDFVAYFSMGRGGGGLRRVSRRAVRLPAGSPGEPAARVQVLYAHALVSTVGREVGAHRDLPKRLARGVRTMAAERARVAAMEAGAGR